MQVPQRLYSLDELKLNGIEASSLLSPVDATLGSIERNLQLAAALGGLAAWNVLGFNPQRVLYYSLGLLFLWTLDSVITFSLSLPLSLYPRPFSETLFQVLVLLCNFVFWPSANTFCYSWRQNASLADSPFGYSPTHVLLKSLTVETRSKCLYRTNTRILLDCLFLGLF